MLSVSSAVALPSMGRAQEMNPPATSALPGDQSQQTPAGKFIQDLGDHAIAIVRNKSLTSDQRAAQYKAMLNNAFDLQTIGRFVLGRAYISAPPEQQQEFMKLFADLIVKIYGDRLNFYSGESFHVKGVRQESDQDMIVNSQIDHPNGADPTLIDWRVRNSNGKLAVIDVIVSGVSQSVTQRQEYSSIIQQGGGKLDALLDRMRQQTQSGPNTNG
jgi:phospholipid transport system substrate-binding protein